MKAIVYRKYGSPDVLELKEVKKPIPAKGEVLIKIHAVALNASDYEFLTAKPGYIRTFGFFRPKYKILGSDIAGIVERVGEDVQQFRAGDEVFGDLLNHSMGGFAQYVCAPESILIRKPSHMSFDEVATLPQSAGVALQGLRDKGQIQSAQKVLINGAGGGSGTFAIQLAKYFGAEVTGVDSAEKLSLMRSIGADYVVNYKQEDITKTGRRYDLILDFVAHRSLFSLRRALVPNGRYVLVGGSVFYILQTALLGPLINRISDKKMGMLLHRQRKEDMDYIIGLIDNGVLTPVIDKTFNLEDVPEALGYLGEGHAKGKVVIRIHQED